MKSSTGCFLVILAGLLVLTVILGFMAYQSLQKEPEEVVGVEAVIPVHVTEVTTGTVEDIVYVTGFVEPFDKVDVIAKIPTPGKLIEAKVRKGDFVSKNQTLATVDRDEVGAIYLAYGVKAPLSGMVASIIDDKGAVITPQVPVASIINIDKVKIKTSLIEADLGRVREGVSARVMVDAYPERVFSGTVTRIEPVLDAFSHTAAVEITVGNSDHSLLPGMFAKVELVSDTHSGVPVVPKEVILKREGKDLAYVIREEVKEKEGGKKTYRIHLVELDLGYYDLAQHEVIEGVEPGDLVVDENLVILKDRTEVSIINPPEEEPKPSPQDQ